MHDVRGINQQPIELVRHTHVFDESALGYKPGSKRIDQGGMWRLDRISAKLSGCRLLAKKAGAAAVGYTRIQIEHTGITAEPARVGMWAHFAFADADHLDAIVVQRGAIAGGFDPDPFFRRSVHACVH